MRGLLLVLSLFALAATVTKVTCITNEEFFNLSKDFATDIEVFDIAENDNDDVESDNVITLPGDPDDEVDFDYILKKLGMDFSNDSTVIKVSDIDEDDSDDVYSDDEITLPGDPDYEMDSPFSEDTTEIEEKTTNLWWRRKKHHRRHRRRPKTFGCKCHRGTCKCCLIKTFRVNLLFKKIKWTLRACLGVTHYPNRQSIMIHFTLQGRRLFNHVISLRNPPKLCFRVPMLPIAKVCLQIYNINIQRKHACVRLVGVLNILVKRFHVHLKLGCFSIPHLDADAFQLMLNSGDFLKFEPLDDAAPSRDLTKLFAGLQKSEMDEFELE